MSSEQITQETVPVEKTSTEAQPQATQATVANADTPAPQPTQSTWKESISETYRKRSQHTKVYRDRCTCKVIHQCNSNDWTR